MSPQSIGSQLVLARRAASLSAAIAAVGIVCLVLLYVGLGLGIDALLPFGPVNDVCVVLQYLLTFPVVLSFHRLLVQHATVRIRLATLAAGVGIVGTSILQYLLLAGRIAFVDQVPYVSVTVLLIGVWIVMTGSLGRRLGVLPIGMGLVISAALYFGFPFWIHRVARHLSALRSEID